MVTTSDTEVGQYVAIQLGGSTLLSTLDNIDEIIDLMPVNRVPGTAPWFLGLGSHKGQLLPVSDLGRYAGGVASTSSANSRLLIINNGRERIGLAVDDVLGLVDAEVQASGDIGDSDVTLPLPLQPLRTDSLALEGKPASLLDLPVLLTQPEFLRITDDASESMA